MKFRSIRGPNWVDASVRVTRMMEKTTPTTVMMAAAIVVRICRAASALPLITQPGNREVTMVGGPVRGKRADEQRDRGHDLEGRHEPQAGAQHLPSPVRA